jgi:PIN domain nuclease of toxin-antitoxin system
VKLLLDTHIWLWSLLEPGRLVPRVAAELEDSANELWLSPVSTWEVLVLAAKGRVELDPGPVAWVRRALRSVPLREASLNHDVALATAGLNLPHQDPADRFLAATALVHDLTLVTADERLLGSEAFRTLANR